MGILFFLLHVFFSLLTGQWRFFKRTDGDPVVKITDKSEVGR